MISWFLNHLVQWHYMWARIHHDIAWHAYHEERDLATWLAELHLAEKQFNRYTKRLAQLDRRYRKKMGK